MALSQKKKKEHQSQKHYSKSLTLSRYSSNQISVPIFERTTNKKKYIFTEPRSTNAYQPDEQLRF